MRMTTTTITKGRIMNLKSTLILLAAIAVLAIAGQATPAFAASPCTGCGPWWHIDSGSAPGRLAPGGEGRIVLLAQNLGDAGASGTVVVKDTLPAGLTVQKVEAALRRVALLARSHLHADSGEEFCAFTSSQVTCTFPQGTVEKQLPGWGFVASYGLVEINVVVKVAAGTLSGIQNTAIVSGGGAAAASGEQPVAIATGAVPFGVEQL